jgi:hypothetical protein
MTDDPSTLDYQAFGALIVYYNPYYNRGSTHDNIE